MGFSAYILESLKRYGRAEMGSFGSFTLDYQPSKWNIANQYFTPPSTKLIWTPAQEVLASLDLMISAVARLHEISWSQASEFLGQSMDKIKSELQQKNKFDLGIIGTFSQLSEHSEIQFYPNPEFSDYLEQSALSIHPLPPVQKDPVSQNWIIWMLLILSLAGFLWIVLGFESKIPEQISSFQSANSAAQEMKGLNVAPAFTDSMNSENPLTTTIPEQRIIITGTFCKSANIRKMKERIEYYQYQVYEEFIDEDCVRLGIFLTEDDNLESTLDDIRKYIEPQAWVLN